MTRRAKRSHGSVPSATPAASSSKDTMAVQEKECASPEVPTQDTSKLKKKAVYWKGPIPLTAEEINNERWKHWREMDTFPRDGSHHYVRISATNRAVDGYWREDCNSIWNDRIGHVNGTQWLDYKSFADIQQCIWERWTKVTKEQRDAYL